ncbi:putative F-box domain-containing protein [Helianthus anomalus]
MEDSDHQPTQSGALIGSNDDLLTEILLRLPVTSIIRFISVSKHWQLLLRHRHFTLRYDTLSNLDYSFAVANKGT